MNPIARLEWGNALALAKAPACALAVGLRLMQHANSTTGEARPGLRDALGVDAAKRGAAWLVRHGWITVARNEPGKPTVYLLTIGKATTTRGTPAPGAKAHRVQRRTVPRGTPAPGPGALLPPEPRKNQGDNQGVAKPHDEDSPAEGTTGQVFLLKGGTPWTLPMDLMATLTRAHAEKDVPGELDRAATWLACNPSKGKTAKGMPRFLNGWMQRAEVVTPACQFPPLPSADPEDDGVHYRPLTRKAAP